MILYNPATDFYHCWMRIASILSADLEVAMEYDRIRIIDYYMCFPKELLSRSLPRTYGSQLKKRAKIIPTGYEDSFSISQAFQQMTEIHRQVIMDMVSKGLIQRKPYQEGILLASTSSATRSLLKEVSDEWKQKDNGWNLLVVEALSDIHLNGKNGLKDRSGLLEFRYDE